jgi:hypothetical protein
VLGLLSLGILFFSILLNGTFYFSPLLAATYPLQMRPVADQEQPAHSCRLLMSADCTGRNSVSISFEIFPYTKDIWFCKDIKRDTSIYDFNSEEFILFHNISRQVLHINLVSY